MYIKGIKMRNIVLRSAVVIMIIAASGCASTTKENTELESPKTKKDISKSNSVSLPKAPKTTTKKIYGANGELDYVISYKDGVITNKKDFTYFESGELNIETFYVNDLKEGVESTYNIYGDISKTEEYKKGKKNGKTIIYHTLTGQIGLDHNYKNDQFQGIQKSYSSSGNIENEWMYDNGIEKGNLSYQYDDNNKLLWTRNYIGDVQSGITKKYNSNGVVVTKTMFNNGVIERYTTYDDKGTIESEDNYINGVRAGVQKVFENGNLKAVVGMKNDKFEGEYKKYHSNGNLMAENQYKNDEIVGLGYGYFDTGELSWEAKYIDGQFLWFKGYNKSGLLTNKFTYKNNLKTGYNREFFELDAKGGGELSWETLYNNGKRITTKQYYRSGSLSKEIEFKDGKAVRGFNYTFKGKKTNMTNAHFHNLGFEY